MPPPTEPDAARSCPYCGAPGGAFIADKTDWPGALSYFRADYRLYRCGGCDLIYAFPLSAATLDGMTRYYAEAYNLARGDDMGAHLAAIWGGGDPLDGPAGWGRRIRRIVRRAVSASPIPPRDRMREVLASADAVGGRTLLDIGCSYGELVAAARRAGIDAYGLEPTEDIVALARGYGARSMTAGRFPADGGPLPAYDVLVMSHVLFYLPAVTPALFAACRRLLNPGGTLIVLAHDGDLLAARDPRLATSAASPLVLNGVTRNFMARAAADAGFSACRHQAVVSEPWSVIHLLTAQPGARSGAP